MWSTCGSRGNMICYVSSSVILILFLLHTSLPLTAFTIFLYKVNKDFNSMKPKACTPIERTSLAENIHKQKHSNVRLWQNQPLEPEKLSPVSYLPTATSPYWEAGKQDKMCLRKSELEWGIFERAKVMQHEESMKFNSNVPVGSHRLCFHWDWQRYQEWLVHFVAFVNAVSFPWFLSKVVETETGLHFRIS